MFASQDMSFSLFGNYVHHFAGLNVALVFMTSVGILGFSIFMIYSILFMLSPFIQSSQTLIPEQCNLKLICIGTIFYLRLCRICIIYRRLGVCRFNWLCDGCYKGLVMI